MPSTTQSKQKNAQNAQVEPPTPPDPTFSITELARDFDVTTRTIRFYEDEGLLKPSRRGTTRIYSKGDRIRLKLVLRGRRLGWSLGEIRDVIGMYDHPGGERKQLEIMIDKLHESRHVLLKQQEDIEHALADLTRLEHNCKLKLEAMDDSGSASAAADAGAHKR